MPARPANLPGQRRGPTSGTPHAIVSLRDGDIDGATDWARQAFTTDRKSINSLSTVADELYHETRARYGNDPAISALNDVIVSFYASIHDR